MADPLLEGLTDEQKRAVCADEGAWLVSAGAGSGKTRVIERRFVRLVKEGKAEVSQILTITFTRKAAAEMGQRIRDRFREEGMTDAMRQLDRAEIKTIDGFCAGLVRRHALALGLDPGFSVIDEELAGIMQRDAFESARKEMVRRRGQAAVDLFAAYEPNRSGLLFKAISDIYGSLRCRGFAEPTFAIPEVDLAAERAGLRQAIEAALEAIRDADANPTQAVLKMKALLEATVEEDPAAAAALLAGNRPAESGGYKDAIIAVNGARERLLAGYRSVGALPVLEMMRDLLAAFGSTYTAAKQAQGVLDFGDLELRVLELLRDRDDIRAAVAGDYRFTMVDEFQDTNPLQFDIINLVAPENRLVVGDANQSIYRFRNAEVELFRRVNAETDAKYCAPLPANFRSQPEIIAFIDALFTMPGMIAPDCYIELEARTASSAPDMPCRVETIVVDADSRAAGKARTPLARAAEAELIARRLQDLFYESRKFAPGDTALLVRTSTDIDIYSQALDRYAIPNYLSIGRDFYKQLEFGDALSLLSLMVNPLDDLALISVLRSPMVEVSDETLMQLRLAAGKGDDETGQPLWPTLVREGSLERFASSESDKLERFVGDLLAMREDARRRPLEETVRAVVNYRDYSAVAAAGVNGKQAYANLMKLRDKAAAYEAAHGRDLPGLVDYLRDLKLEESRETQAPVEEEAGGGAVRIMTIHSAKGLEFELVVWANLGYSPPRDNPYIICDEEGRVGLRYREIGDKDFQGLFDHAELVAENEGRELEEDKRVGYVAMTRARSHLILSGATNIDNEPEGSESSRPIEWVRELLGITADGAAVAALIGDGPVSSASTLLETDCGPVGLTLCSDPQALVDSSGERAATGSDTEIPVCDAAITALPEPARFQPAVVAATDIDTYAGCSYRYYIERILHLGAIAAGGGVPVAAPEPGRTLDVTEMGTLVHAVLEHHPELSSPELVEVSNDFIGELARRELGPESAPSTVDCDAVRKHLGIFSGLPSAAALKLAAAEGRLNRELPFTVNVGGTIVRGIIDALVELDDGLLVVDYKTGRPDTGSDGDGAGKYRFQMATYALAASRMRPGPVRVVLMFLGGEGAEREIGYDSGGAAALEDELSAAIAGFADGFVPLPELDAGQCGFCTAGPANTRLCPTVRAQ